MIILCGLFRKYSCVPNRPLVYFLLVRPRESEGTACVVVSSTRIESCLFIYFLHVRPRTYGHARAKERPVWLFLVCGLKKNYLFIFCSYLHARESEGTACVVVSDTRFESFFYLFTFCTYGHSLTGTRERRNGLCGCF